MNTSQIVNRLRNSALFKDSFWALTGSALGRGLSLLATIAIARFLGSDAYGQYGMIKSTLLSIAIFSSFGLGFTATKFIAEIKGKSDEDIHRIHRVCFITTLISAAFIALIVVIIANPLAVWLKDPSMANIFRWSSIAIIINALITTQNGELAGFRAYRLIAKNTTFYGVFTFAISVPAAYFYGLTGAVIALIISLAFNWAINFISLNNLLPSGSWDVKMSDFKRIINFSLPIALQESTYSITSWCGMAIIVKMADYSQLGVYSAASQWSAVMLFIPGSLRNVALSHLSENSSDKKTSMMIVRRLLSVNFVSTFIPFLIIAALSHFISTLYGESYAGLPSVLNICIFTAVVSSLSNVITQDLIAHSKNWYLFWSRLIRDCSALIIAYLLILQESQAAIAFATAWLICQTAYLMVIGIKLKRIYNTKS